MEWQPTLWKVTRKDDEMAERDLESMNIYQKLAEIRRPVEVIKKNRKGFGYTYADEEEILSKISGLMRKYNISLIPGIVPGTTKVAPYQYEKTKFTKDGTQYEEKVNEILVTADTMWTWVNNDNPEERIEVPWALVGCQSDASQSFGSGLTYSSRYFLLKYFNVATSDANPEEYRRKQSEAEGLENKLIAEKIVEEINKLVNELLADHPEKRDDVITITKKYVRVNGKPSGNYLSITDPAVASELLNALKAGVINN